MAIELNEEFLEDLLDFISENVRDSSGFGNNQTNPSWGAAATPFIRLTEASYADGAAALRTTINTPRQISDILSNQDNDGNGVEENLPNSFGGSAFLTFFGQYFDHGLDFVGKGQPGSVAIGSPTFPMNGSRANIIEGTGIDPDGVPGNGDEIAAQHLNLATPLVDQNQAYGSHDAVTDLLREWTTDGLGNAVQTAYLLGGATDATGRQLLPTLDVVRENFRVMTGGDELTSADISNYQGTGQALLLDFIPVFTTGGQLDLDALGHYYIAGDGRLNENVMLTTMHTIWARNHNFWVDELREATGGGWSENQYFEAARAMNIIEYQRVVFTDFANAMAGGLDGPDDNEHGFDGYDPTIDPSISAEFAHVAYRFGHSMLNEFVAYRDQATSQLHEMSLVGAFLNPGALAGLTVDGLIQGAMTSPHQAIDIDVVNALRNQLVGRPLDLAALNIFRGRDTGVAAFNEVRTQLFASTAISNLEPYTGWDDFQLRNDLSDSLMDSLRAAYPEGFEAMDLWVGGLLEAPQDGQLGSTFGYIFLEQLDRLQNGDRFYYLNAFDDELFANEPNRSLSFGDIIERNTGLTNLPDDVFQNFTVRQLSDLADLYSGNALAELFLAGGGDDVLHLGDGDDNALGGLGNDTIHGQLGGDVIRGEDGNDALSGDWGNDGVHGGAGNDRIYGGHGNDVLAGDAGNDTIYAGFGIDSASGGAGNDIFFDLDNGAADHFDGGAGQDTMSFRNETAAVVIDLFDQANNGGIAANDRFANIERFFGSSHGDTMTGGTAAEHFEGLAGADVLDGGGGNDWLVGGAGGDSLLGSEGNDTLLNLDNGERDEFDGGAGYDTVSYKLDVAAVVVDLGNGANNGGAAAQDTYLNIERYVGTVFGDTMIGAGAADRFDGEAGNDQLSGGGGNDLLVGGAGDDTMTGGVGVDWFLFGAGFGNDTITDFDALAPGGQDKISLVPHAITAASFATSVSIAADGADTLISIGANTITLTGVSATDVTAADFVLA